MNIFKTLADKSWDPEIGGSDQRPSGAGTTLQARRIALRVFLGIVAMLFTLMIVAYAGRMGYEDWRPAPQLRLLWGNTLVLIGSSAFLQWALHSVRNGRFHSMRTGLLAAGLFTVVFLYGQVLAWRQLADIVLGDYGNPAVGFFYMITGVHGAHMLGGLAVWSRTTLRAWGHFNLITMQHSVANCALYWHFLLGVWLVLFGLLFSGNNFELILEICGLR